MGIRIVLSYSILKHFDDYYRIALWSIKRTKCVALFNYYDDVYLPESISVALTVTTEEPIGASSKISLEKLIGSNMGALSLRSIIFI